MSEPAPTLTPSSIPQLPLFLSLPRELRDAIYTFCAQPTPTTHGPLSGYAELGTELLAINKQIRTEYQLIFYKLLPTVLSQNKVCLRLGSADSKAKQTYCCGWNFWKLPGAPWHDGKRRIIGGGLQVWIHRVPREGEGEVSWWMDVSQIEERRERSVPAEVMSFAALLGRIVGHGEMQGMDLRRVGFVRERLRRVVESEDKARESWIGGRLLSLRSFINKVGGES